MSYRAGRRFEYRTRDIFRKFGYQCDRKAASSPYDLLVQKGGKTIFLVECKKTGKNDYIYISKDDVTKLIVEARKQKAIPLVAYGFRRTPVFVIEPNELPKTNKMFKVAKGENTPLSDFLKAFKQGKRK